MELPRLQTDDQHTPNLSEPFSIERARAIIENGTLRALKTLVDTLDDPEASASEQNSAAMKIIEMGHSKKLPGLSLQQSDESNVAYAIADAIRQSKFIQPE